MLPIVDNQCEVDPHTVTGPVVWDFYAQSVSEAMTSNHGQAYVRNITFTSNADMTFLSRGQQYISPRSKTMAS